MIRSVTDRLRPGGTLVIKDLDSGPAWKFHWNRIHDRIVAGPDPIWCRPPAEMAALVTDAGMPGVSDPGARVVSACRAAGLKVYVVPGPSAVTSAMALAGFASGGFVFGEFLPNKSKARRRRLAELGTGGLPIVLFESPYRLLKLADDVEAVLGARRMVVARAGGRNGPPRRGIVGSGAGGAELLPGQVARLGPWDVSADEAVVACAVRPAGEVAIDAEQVVLPLAVRARRPGDRLRPLGAAGRRKVQDIFVDRKVPRASRDTTPIVVDALGRIVWVAGHVVAHDARVMATTTRMLLLTLRPAGGAV